MRVVVALLGLCLLASRPVVAEEADGQWTMPALNYASTRFSELGDVNAKNVGNLKLAWTFSTGINRGHEAGPLVVGKTMYVVTPFPNLLYALDLENNGAAKWKYDPKPKAAAQGVACCDLVNRGCMFYEGNIYYNTLDGHTVAVNAETGEEVWKTKVGNINIGETITMAPLVVKGKVLVGNSGGEFGVRGWITALDSKTGKVAWKAYNTGPDADCLIGERFKPFYAMDQGRDLGVKTWPAEHWKIGGGNVWGWISYDPELDLIYHGTGNSGCWNPDLRPGDNKWTTGIFARDPDDGQAVWYYQWSPHDLYDHDGINESLLLDLPVGEGGKTRKVLVHAERNGYVYVMDRATGEVLSATPFVRITSSKGVDLKTGRLIPEESKKPKTGKVVRDIAPFAPGAKDWQPCAFSPRTGLLYIPHQTMTMDFEGTEANYIAGTPFLGADVKMYADPVDPGDGSRGAYTAWDPVKKEKRWRIKEKFPVWSGTLATAGDVTFYGTMEGWFKAIDANTGEVLWKFKCGSGIIGQPVTYRGPDGKQYIAILSGVGGWAGAIVAGDLDPRDPTGALGFLNGMRDLPEHTTKGGMLHVFTLP
jgi:PQQ-dependent dehydrogenase (methanol/ethanol family)